jgi:hypothetical protein
VVERVIWSGGSTLALRKWAEWLWLVGVECQFGEVMELVEAEFKGEGGCRGGRGETQEECFRSQVPVVVDEGFVLKVGEDCVSAAVFRGSPCRAKGKCEVW